MNLKKYYFFISKKVIKVKNKKKVAYVKQGSSI